MSVSDVVDLIDFGRILGICPRKSDGSIDARVYMALNRSSYRLLNRGDWIGSTQVAKFCVSERCITVPRQVERIDSAKLNGMVLDVRNPWYSYMPPISDVCSNGLWFGYGPFDIGGSNLIDAGYHATFRDIVSGSKKLRIYPDSPNDVGKEVLIQAYDDNSQFIIESADYSGFKMTVALPYVESAYFVRSIVSVIKPETYKNLNLYEADTSGNLRALAIYEPSETTIELRRYELPTVCGSCANQTLLALVKLKHIPLKRETDQLVIENPAALEEMMRSLEKKDAGQTKDALDAEFNAVRELNLEKRNRSPSDEIAITVRTQGSAQPWRHGVGRLR